MDKIINIVYQILVRKPERKRSLRRRRYRREDNINMDMKRIICDGVERTRLRRGTGGGLLRRR
jgi:hypothetical protein